jgi:hypothetical protein
MTAHGCSVGTLALALLSVTSVRAEPAEVKPGRATLASSVRETVAPSFGDGVYGRLDGDLELGLGLGGEFDSSGPLAAGRLSASYFWTAGVYVGYANALGSKPRHQRTVSVGVDFRPLFIPRWSQSWEQGPALVDLTLDSLSFGLGAYWAWPGEEVARKERGLEVSLGGGVPLFARARGLWLELRGILRAPEPFQSGAEGSLLLLFGWREMVSTPLSD